MNNTYYSIVVAAANCFNTIFIIYKKKLLEELHI